MKPLLSSSEYPAPWMILICLMKVLLPLSPVPEEGKERGPESDTECDTSWKAILRCGLLSYTEMKQEIRGVLLHKSVANQYGEMCGQKYVPSHTVSQNKFRENIQRDMPFITEL